jgi:hypothetical protein
MSKEAMKLAIKTLLWANEEINGWRDDAYGHDPIDHSEIMLAIKALEEALAKKEQGEPRQEDYLSKAYRLANELRCHLAIAPAPQQRTWVGLTEEDRLDAKIKGCSLDDYIEIVEAKLKEKNG